MTSRDVDLMLMGGFGNVLFQLNFVDIINTSNSDLPSINANGYFIQRAKLMQKCFGISNHNVLSILEELGFQFNSRISLWSLYCLFLSKKTGFKVFNTVYYGRKKINYIDLLRNKYIMAYCQNDFDISESFVTDLKNKIKKIPPTDLSEYECVVHFRGGDFDVNNEMLFAQYYIESLQDHKNILVLTDDKERAKSFFKSKCDWLKLHFVSNKTLLEEFRILTDARKIISSNSTFCWWGAELSEAVVIQPKDFYGFPWKPNSLKTRIEK